MNCSVDSSLGYGRVSPLTSNAGYNEITVSRDPIVGVIVKWSIVILTVIIVLGMIQSFGVMMPWETGSTIAASAGSIVYVSGNDVMISIINEADMSEISSLSLYLENTGEKINVEDVQQTIHSGEPIMIKGLADGLVGESNIILTAKFEGGATKVLSTTYLQFS